MRTRSIHTLTSGLALVAIAALLFTGCVPGERSPGQEYASQMYHSIPLEPYSQTEYNTYLAKGMNAQAPVQGTVARGKLAYYYPYPKTNEGYEAAGKELRNPLPPTTENLDEGARLYKVYCSHCHGAEGAGDGAIIKAEKFPIPPAYTSARIKELSVGKMFHSITHGINVMGAHGSQVTPEERWKIIWHIRKLRGDDIAALQGGAADAPTAKADTSATAEANATPAPAPAAH